MTKLYQKHSSEKKTFFSVYLNLLKVATDPTTHSLVVVIIYSFKIQRISIQNNFMNMCEYESTNKSRTITL